MSRKPVPKVRAAGAAGGTVLVAVLVALILGARPEDPLVQAITAAVLAFAPVLAGYVKRDPRPTASAIIHTEQHTRELLEDFLLYRRNPSEWCRKHTGAP